MFSTSKQEFSSDTENIIKEEPSLTSNNVESNFFNLLNNCDGVNPKYRNISIIFDDNIEDAISTNSLYLSCQECGEEYEDFCTKCSMLSNVLNNITSTETRPEDTLPKNILKINKINEKFSVCAIRTIPKNVIFGPFDGIASTESTYGYVWEIKDGKFKTENSNWMQYINFTNEIERQNLHVLQYKNEIYFCTKRGINEGEELFICVENEYVRSVNDGGTTHLIPMEIKLDIIYACTLCCYGFNSEIHLLQHNAKCVGLRGDIDIEGNFMQCPFCNVHLDKREYLKHHLDYCCGKYLRKCTSSTNGSELTYKCQMCEFKTKYKKSLKSHVYLHLELKPFECDLCPKKFVQRSHHALHMTRKHQTGEEYNCPKCDYKTIVKGNLKMHQLIHEKIKPHQCYICNKSFAQKSNFLFHLRDKHEFKLNKEYHCKKCDCKCGNLKSFNEHICKGGSKAKKEKKLVMHIETESVGVTKDFKCSKCDYQTNRISSFKNHIFTHDKIKPYKCKFCGKGFIQKNNLVIHLKRIHPTDMKIDVLDFGEYIVKTAEKSNYKRGDNMNDFKSSKNKIYNCKECNYGTDLKTSFDNHLYIHQDVKPFKCRLCDKSFTQKNNLSIHVKDKHGKNEEDNVRKDYKCSQCNYETNRLGNLKHHRYRHEKVKPFKCELCINKGFTQKNSLLMHLKRIHKLK